MEKRLVFFLLLISLVLLITGCSNMSSISKPSITVYGTIMDKADQTAITNAIVSIGNNTTHTNSSGKYNLTVSGNSTVEFKVNKEGYWGENKSFYLGNSNVNFGQTSLNKKTDYAARVTGHINVGSLSTKQAESIKKGNNRAIPLKKIDSNRQPDYVQGEILVKFKDSLSPQSIVQNNNSQGTIMSLNDQHHIYKVKSTNLSTEELYQNYKNMQGVAQVSYNYIGYPMGTTNIPNDPYYKDDYQWNLNNINMLPAWSKSTGSSSVTVAVIDTGYLPHKDLVGTANSSGNIDTDLQYDFTDRDNLAYDDDAYYNSSSDYLESHGTHVAGIIGAIGNNDYGITGVDWNVNIMPLRIFEAQGDNQYFTTDRLIDAIYYAVDNGASVINLSLAIITESKPDNYDYSLIEEALKYAHDSGVTVVAAAGNGLNNGVRQIGQAYVFYPASSQYTIAVGATDINNQLTYYSNYGDRLDIVAPGGDYYTDNGIWSTMKYSVYDQDEYAFLSGTSMAAPQVSAVAALLIAQGIRDPYEVKDMLTGNAQNIGDSHLSTGVGLLDAGATLGDSPDNNFYVDVKIFAAYLDGDTYYLASNITGADYNGYYDLAYVEPNKDLVIIGWIDENNNNIIDSGDYFSTSQTLNLNENQQINNVDINLSYQSLSTASLDKHVNLEKVAE